MKTHIIASALFLITVISAYAADVSLEWDRNKEKHVKSYRLYYGADKDNLTLFKDSDNKTEITITGLNTGVEYYFEVTAYIESDRSNQVKYTVPLQSCTTMICH